MALNIKNVQVEELVAEIAKMTGESKTGAVLQALRERHARLRLRVADESKGARMRRFLEREVWPKTGRDPVGGRSDGGGSPGDESRGDQS